MESKSNNSWAFELALCLLGPFFFLTNYFAFLAPLPILYLHRGLENKEAARWWAFGAAIFGFLICFRIQGVYSSLGFLLFISFPMLLIGELLSRGKRPEYCVIVATTIVALITFMMAMIHSNFSFAALNEELRALLVNFLESKLPELEKAEGGNPDSIKQIKEIIAKPELFVNNSIGIGLSTLLFMYSLPLIALIRWNPKNFRSQVGIARDFLRNWRCNEYLIWPTMISGLFVVWEGFPQLTQIANNVIKPLLVIYFFQGTSILAFYLDLLRIRGHWRVAIYGFTMIFFNPMLVSIGFVDLWFNFRDRSKKKTQPSDE